LSAGRPLPITARMRRLAGIALVCGLLAAALAAAGPAAAATPHARILPNGQAVAPPSAPPAVTEMIEAGNRIRHRPYRWGGGHRSWVSKGYDCSGSVSYVMHAAGLLESPLDSTGFMHWGGGGAGSWVRIYANQEHVFAVIAGLRWDTSAVGESFNQGSGPRWRQTQRDATGYAAKYFPGL
jgi:hypothetical protein